MRLKSETLDSWYFCISEKLSGLEYRSVHRKMLKLSCGKRSKWFMADKDLCAQSKENQKPKSKPDNKQKQSLFC